MRWDALGAQLQRRRETMTSKPPPSLDSIRLDAPLRLTDAAAALAFPAVITKELSKAGRDRDLAGSAQRSLPARHPPHREWPAETRADGRRRKHPSPFCAYEGR